MSWKKVLKPTWIKIIAVIVILLALYFYLLFNIKINYECLTYFGSEECVKQTQELAIQDTLIIGIPLAIIAWIIIGIIEEKRSKTKLIEKFKVNKKRKRK